MFSAMTDHTLSACAYLASQSPSVYVFAKDIAKEIKAAPFMLSKMLQTMTREQNPLLESNKGPRGGFRLATPPHQITVGALVGLFSAAHRQEHTLLYRLNERSMSRSMSMTVAELAVAAGYKVHRDWARS